jgi:hypothetical protein
MQDFSSKILIFLTQKLPLALTGGLELIFPPDFYYSGGL